MGRSISLVVIGLLILMGCGPAQKTEHTGYDFSAPDETWYLPEELNEISGLQWDVDLLAVQDEKGTVFRINPINGEVLNEAKFGKDGDFEGVTVSDEFVYVLKSNGTVVRIAPSGATEKAQFPDNKDFDFEGLCALPLTNRLLVACKEHGKGKKNHHLYIYSIDLSTFRYEEKPFFKIHKEQVHPKFMASGIALHPSGDVYVLSARSATLLVLSSLGDVKVSQQLNTFVFRQPEGITFDPEGNLYISNEKNDGPPTILMFRPVHAQD